MFLGLLMRQEDLAVFALVLLLLSFGARAWSRLCADGVIIGFRVGRQRLMHGEATTVELLFENTSFWPMRAQARLKDAGALVLEPADPSREGRLPGHGRLHLEWRVRGLRRGVYQVGPPMTEIGDPFGFSYLSRDTGAPSEVVVYPRLVRINSTPLEERGVHGLRPWAGLVGDPVQVTGTREYQPGQPARYIHWKASARLGRLQEKIFESSRGEKVLLSVGVSGFCRAEDLAGLEEAIEAAGSMAVLMAGRGVEVGMATDARIAGGRTGIVRIGAGAERTAGILELLARIGPEPGGELVPLIRRVLRGSAGLVCVHFARGMDADTAALDMELRQRQIPGVFLLKDTPGDAGPGKKALSGRMIPINHVLSADGENR